MCDTDPSKVKVKRDILFEHKLLCSNAFFLPPESDVLFDTGNLLCSNIQYFFKHYLSTVRIMCIGLKKKKI